LFPSGTDDWPEAEIRNQRNDTVEAHVTITALPGEKNDLTSNRTVLDSSAVLGPLEVKVLRRDAFAYEGRYHVVVTTNASLRGARVYDGVSPNDRENMEFWIDDDEIELTGTTFD